MPLPPQNNSVHSIGIAPSRALKRGQTRAPRLAFSPPQVRKQAVEQEQELAKTLQRELWLEKAAATALAREEVLLEIEAEREAARERADERREQHDAYAPRLTYPYRKPPRKTRAPLKLNSIVSAN